MTLLSDQADAVRALVESADPRAVWAVGGPDGPHAGSHGGDEILDVGGLTAVLALWPAVGALVEDGALRLHTPLAAYGDEAAAGTPAGTTAHHLLTRPGGTAALVRLVEHLGGATLAELASVRVWNPLGMTRTRLTHDTLSAPLADLALFLGHLLHPGAPASGVSAPVPLTRAWTAESLRIRTGELTPARGLLWHPAPHGVWTHHAETDPGAAVWISPRRHRWAVLLPAVRGPLRTAFREAVFTPGGSARSGGAPGGIPRA